MKNISSFLVHLTKLILYVMCYVFAITSCHLTSVIPESDQELERPLIVTSTITDLSRYNYIATKGSQQYDTIPSIAAMLDYSKTTTLTLKSATLTQVPFIWNNEERYAYFSKDIPDEICSDSLAVIKYFLISVSYPSSGQTYKFMVTMITSHEYAAAREISYIDKPNYSGVIIYSDLNGELVELKSYYNGLVIRSAFLRPSDSISDTTEKRFVTIFSKNTTKATEEKEIVLDIEAAYCIADKPDDDTDNNTPSGGSNNSDNFSNSGGDIPPATNDNNFNNDNKSHGESAFPNNLRKPAISETEYTIKLSSTSGGSTSGGGRYAKGTAVLVTGIPYRYNRLDAWTGDIFGNDTHVFLSVTENISATAYFVSYLLNRRACIDTLAKKANPLSNMTLATTDAEGKDIVQATFGYTRDNFTQKHNGLDLYGEVGTPIYSISDGVISDKPYVISQPAKVNKKYPDSYNGDKNKAGNRIYVEGTVNGKHVKVGYWHLKVGDPVAINPRTGKIFEPGDEVFTGDLIGYIGRSGNASNVPNPHLHLVVYENGIKVNPANYLNGTISTTSIIITNITCNE